MSKKQMTREDRHTLETLLKMKTPVSEIAKQFGRHRSTIYKEIKKGLCEQLDKNWNTHKVYLYDVAQKKHDDLSHNKGAKRKLEPDDTFLQEISEWILKKKYSPEAALYKVKDKKLCVKSVYNYVHAGAIKDVTAMSLPYARPKKKKKEKVEKRAFKRGRSIEERPEHINERKEYGHWEMDTVYSSKDDLTCLLVLSERMTREEIIIQIKDRAASSVIRALDRYERQIGSPAFREKFKTMTCDNGMEFADWESIERSSRNKGNRTTIYFCHPYSSSERGTNENMNRMIRRWIPKGDDIGLYSPQEIQEIQDWINNYPRKIHKGKSANEYIAYLQNPAELPLLPNGSAESISYT